MRPPLAGLPKQIDRYLLGRLLGSGREGDVYLAKDVRKGVLRTLKVLRGRNMVAEAEHTAAQYRRLARVSSVKRFRDWGVLRGQSGVGDRAWLAFDYVDGVTLARQIAFGRVKDPLAMLLRVCAALLPVHRRGLAIGDLDHGRNVLLERESGHLKFCDLDAGVPNGTSPEAKDDFWELASLARVAHRRLERSMPPRVTAAILDAQTLDEVMLGLRRAARDQAKARPP